MVSMKALSEGKFNSAGINYVASATEYKVLTGSRGIIGLANKGNVLTRSPGSLAKHVTAKYSMMFHNYVCQIACTVKLNQSKPSNHSDTKALI